MSEKSIHLSIKELAEDDRPREKLLSLGRQNLSDAELLAIILGSGNKTQTAVQLAQYMLSQNKNNINELAKLNVNELKKYKGVGTVKAINISAAFELGRRRNDFETEEKIAIQSSNDAYKFLFPRLGDLPHEEFWMLILNVRKQILKFEFISKGGISGTVVDVRLICKSAIENNASAIVIAHNHPSGNLIPSNEDKIITEKLKKALLVFDIKLIDHLIIGDRNYYSFADEGVL
jgi:DNA repair protein RadC